ncbi:hypothetical protein EXN66_Car019414 [Channa argus]|uniref:Retinoic acid receptor responder protein 2 n=1 Tax=Channa argus TaxID=215402 RepID=A0A6G1QNS0_CHAAH|nr:hypothetical protein EXN66_Car019414 [Channa argus]
MNMRSVLASFNAVNQFLIMMRKTVCPTPLTVTDTEKKMAALELLLLSVGALFFSSNAQDAYNNLAEIYRKGVDVGLQKVNSHAGIQHHFLFYKSVTTSETELGFGVTYVFNHFYLKATKCQKGTTDSRTCQFRNDRRKMAAGLLLLVCAGAVLFSAKAQDSYDGLPDNYKKGVDLAFDQLNSHARVNHHFRFLKSVERSDIEAGFGVRYLYHHFTMRPTRCAKGTTDSTPQRCPFRNDREILVNRVEHCKKMSYNSGAPTLLASTA